MLSKTPLVLLGPDLNRSEIREFFCFYPKPSPSTPKTFSIVAVDKGYAHVQTFVKIAQQSGFFCQLEFAIGDWDSLGFVPTERVSSSLHFQKIFTLPVYKNKSDLAAALIQIQKSKESYSSCILLGFQGGRMDHHYAVIHDVDPFVEKYPVISWGREGVMVFGGEIGSLTLQSTQKGALVSVFPMHSVLKGVQVSGLRFSPARGILRPGSHGLSNLTNGGRIQIRWKVGRLLVLFPDRSSVKISV